MKKSVYTFAALLCLLTFLVGATACVHIAPQKQSSCDHCPKQSQPAPACCEAQQQQQPAVASTEVEPQIQLHAIAFIAMFDELPSPLNIATPRLTATPPLPPRTPLRI
jgi:hypothetical protein